MRCLTWHRRAGCKFGPDARRSLAIDPSSLTKIVPPSLHAVVDVAASACNQFRKRTIFGSVAVSGKPSR